MRSYMGVLYNSDSHPVFTSSLCEPRDRLQISFPAADLEGFSCSPTVTPLTRDICTLPTPFTCLSQQCSSNPPPVPSHR